MTGEKLAPVEPRGESPGGERTEKFIGESCVLVDKAGRSVSPSIAWFDRRTEKQAQEIAEKFGRARIFAITFAIGTGIPVTIRSFPRMIRAAVR